MKKPLLTVAFALLLPQTPALAAEAEANFDAQTGVLEIPELEMDGAVFYVRLNLVNANDLTFDVNLDSAVNLSPRLDNEASDSDIVGSWNGDGVDIRYSFEADGSFSMVQGEGVDNQRCPEGGAESGSYGWTARTGVLLTNLNADLNGDCGTSSDTLLRMFVDGNVLTVFAGDTQVLTMTR